MVPPDGVTSNFENPTTRAATQIQATAPVLGVALLFWINRIYVKNWLMRQWTWDDGTLLVGVVSAFYAKRRASGR